MEWVLCLQEILQSILEIEEQKLQQSYLYRVKFRDRKKVKKKNFIFLNEYMWVLIVYAAVCAPIVQSQNPTLPPPLATGPLTNDGLWLWPMNTKRKPVVHHKASTFRRSSPMCSNEMTNGLWLCSVLNQTNTKWRPNSRCVGREG